MMSHKRLSHRLYETNQHYDKDQFGEEYEICNRCYIAIRVNPDLKITHCPNCQARFR